MEAPQSAQWLRPLPQALDLDQIAFLGREYDHIASSFISNEESGEKRVSLFLSFVGVASVALGIIAESLEEPRGTVEWAIGLTAALVLVFGLMTLQRTIGRNVHTDELLNALARIRAFFIGSNSEVAYVLPYIPGENPKRRMRGVPGKRWWGLSKGGVLEMVALANAYLLGAVGGAFLAATGVRGEVWAGGAALLAVIGWLLQMRYARYCYCRDQSGYEVKRQEQIAIWTGGT